MQTFISYWPVYEKHCPLLNQSCPKISLRPLVKKKGSTDPKIKLACHS